MSLFSGPLRLVHYEVVSLLQWMIYQGIEGRKDQSLPQKLKNGTLKCKDVEKGFE